MTRRINHRGKYFTDVISKDEIRTTLQTLTVRIIGNVHVRPNVRFKDELNKTDQFIAVTDAVIYNARDEELYRSNFMVVNRDHILWIAPEDELDEQYTEEEIET